MIEEAGDQRLDHATPRERRTPALWNFQQTVANPGKPAGNCSRGVGVLAQGNAGVM